MENSIVWYRSRKFWAIVYALMLAWSVFFYFGAFYNPHALNFFRIINDIIMSLGGSFFGLWGRLFLGTFGAYLGILLYFISQLYFITKTFRLAKVKLLFPLLFTINFILGVIMNILYLGSFA